jgi:hypothetical protein
MHSTQPQSTFAWLNANEELTTRFALPASPKYVEVASSSTHDKDEAQIRFLLATRCSISVSSPTVTVGVDSFHSDSSFAFAAD